LCEADRKGGLLHSSTIAGRLDGVQVAFADARPGYKNALLAARESRAF